MNIGKFLMGTLVGGIVALVLGWLVYGMLLTDFMAEHNTMPMKEAPDWLWLIIGHLAWGALITYIYLNLANIRTFMSGAQAGLVIGLLLALAWNLIGYSVGTSFDLTYVVVDSVIGAILTAIVGGVVGMVLGMGGSTQPAPAMH